MEDTIKSVEYDRDIIVVHITNGLTIKIGSAYLPPEFPEAFFHPGAVIEEKTETALNHAAACLTAEKAALRLISRGEQYQAGLERKLALRKHHPEAIRVVLDRLTALNLVNDRRYAELWLKYRLGRNSRGSSFSGNRGSSGNRGPRFLGMQLRAKGINRECAEAALEAVFTPDAEAALLERCVKKFGPGTGSGSSPKGRTRRSELTYFLKTQGFSAEAITRYLEQEDVE
ncbi:hypothetical protein AGMMS50230_17230 [Spirochaetia bacterium]|nr:hypothetical protein AGMMS50230_17230 [Spirochaetia bacterium]